VVEKVEKEAFTEKAVDALEKLRTGRTGKMVLTAYAAISCMLMQIAYLFSPKYYNKEVL
jgi:hypothetical protein